MKLCGYLETCFHNGEDIWGHLGSTMCWFLCEDICGSYCKLDKRIVQIYFSQKEKDDIIKEHIRRVMKIK